MRHQQSPDHPDALLTETRDVRKTISVLRKSTLGAVESISTALVSAVGFGASEYNCSQRAHVDQVPAELGDQAKGAKDRAVDHVAMPRNLAD